MIRVDRDLCYFELLAIITGRQLRAARALLGWEQVELAKKSKVAVGTIRRMEGFAGEIGCLASTLAKVKTTLEKAGVEFDVDNSGIRLKSAKR